MDHERGGFAWNRRKEAINFQKHGVRFDRASRAFLDPERKIYVDSRHSRQEERFFCLGKVAGRVMTVRFVYRNGLIRIFGAGYWRKGTRYYEKEDRS